MTNRPTARTLCVPGDHPSLAAALAAATPGDTVMMMESVTGPTPIRCVDGVIIEAIAGVVLRGKGDKPVLLVENAVDVRLFGLQLTHTTTGAAALCEIRGAAVELRHCTFSGARGHGLVALDGARLRLKRCAFVANAGDGLHLDGPAVHAEVMDCSAAENGGFALRVLGGGDAYIERLAARGNGGGVFAGGDATRVTCRTGVIETNHGPGLVAQDSAMLRMEGNTVTANAGGGVVANGAGTNLVARRNVVACNEGGGFSAGAGTVTMLDGNTCGGNSGAGIELLGPGTRAEIFANECAENGRGIVTEGEVSGVMEDNVCRSNSTDDFSVTGESLRLIRNEVGQAAVPA